MDVVLKRSPTVDAPGAAAGARERWAEPCKNQCPAVLPSGRVLLVWLWNKWIPLRKIARRARCLSCTRMATGNVVEAAQHHRLGLSTGLEVVWHRSLSRHREAERARLTSRNQASAPPLARHERASRFQRPEHPARQAPWWQVPLAPPACHAGCFHSRQFGRPPPCPPKLLSEGGCATSDAPRQFQRASYYCAFTMKSPLENVSINTLPPPSWPCRCFGCCKPARRILFWQDVNPGEVKQVRATVSQEAASRPLAVFDVPT